MLKTIVLIGMMGSGKTSVGKELAKKLDLEVITTEKDFFRLKKIGYENIKFVT